MYCEDEWIARLALAQAHYISECLTCGRVNSLVRRMPGWLGGGVYSKPRKSVVLLGRESRHTARRQSERTRDQGTARDGPGV